MVEKPSGRFATGNRAFRPPGISATGQISVAYLPGSARASVAKKSGFVFRFLLFKSDTFVSGGDDTRLNNGQLIVEDWFGICK